MLAPGKHNWGPPRTSQVPDGALCSPPAALSGSPPGIRDGLPGDRHPWCRPTGGHGSQSLAGPSAQSHEAQSHVHGSWFPWSLSSPRSRKLSTPVQGGQLLETREGRVLWLHMVGASPHFSPPGFLVALTYCVFITASLRMVQLVEAEGRRGSPPDRLLQESDAQGVYVCSGSRKHHPPERTQHMLVIALRVS